MESDTKTSKKGTWTPERKLRFQKTMAAKAKAKAKTKTKTKTKTKVVYKNAQAKPKVKRSGVIPFHAIPDEPKRTYKAKTSATDDRVQLARELIAFARELLK